MKTISNTQIQAARILIVEDDAAIRSALADGLGMDGHKVSVAEDVAAARRRLQRTPLDLVLLDVNLPDGSGYELLREVRSGSHDGRSGQARSLPILMLSGRTEEIDRVRAFELGCDDYIAKPYSFGELRGRVAAVLRRSDTTAPNERIQIGQLDIDRRSRAVWLEGKRIHLTFKEYSLLLALAADPQRVFTREELLQTVWGYRTAGSTRTLDAHACRLRAKLSGGADEYVLNLWGVGYRLVDQGGEAA
jgi:DNA-binding response OmpR family regulator